MANIAKHGTTHTTPLPHRKGQGGVSTIEVKNISKTFGKVKALKDVSFSVEKGEIFGLIGPDGAGKTTLFRILASLLLPEGGTVSVDGSDTKSQMKEDISWGTCPASSHSIRIYRWKRT